MIMKIKITNLIAFFLSLSFILLLEAAPLGLLAEDIKPKQKKEVEIELLLSASNELSDDNVQAVKAERTEKIQEEQHNELEKKEEKNTEADNNSSEETGGETNQLVKKENNQNEDEIKTENEKQTSKEEIKEKDESKIQSQEIKNKEGVESIAQDRKLSVEEKLEKTEAAEEKQDEPPAWLKKLESEDEKELSNTEKKEETAEKKRDKFDLESYLSELEKEDEKTTDAQSLRANESHKKSEKDKINNLAADEDKEEVKENKVYDLRKNTAGIKKPGIKKYSQPEYPSNLRKRNIEGEVIISLRINKKGKSYDLEINKSSGYDSFDQAALNAVEDWEFEAAELGEDKVEVIVNIPIIFELN